MKNIKYLLLILFVPVMVLAKPQIGHVCIGGKSDRQIQSGCDEVRKRLTDCGFEVITADIGEGKKLFDTNSRIKEKLRTISEINPEVPVMISSHGVCGSIKKGAEDNTDRVIFNLNKAGSYKDFYFCQSFNAVQAEVGNLLAVKVDKRSLVSGSMIASLIKGNCNRPLYVSACHAGALVCDIDKPNNLAVSCKNTEVALMDNKGVESFEAAVVKIQCLSIAKDCTDFDAYDQDRNNVLDSTEVNKLLGYLLTQGEIFATALPAKENKLALIKRGVRIATQQEEVEFIKNCRQNGVLKERASEDLTESGNIHMSCVVRNDTGIDTCVYNGTNSEGKIETWSVLQATKIKPSEQGYLKYPDKSSAPEKPSECFDPAKREERPECALYSKLTNKKQPDCAPYMNYLSNSSYPKTCPCPSGTCSDCWTTATGNNADVTLICYAKNISPPSPGQIKCNEDGSQNASTYNITVKKQCGSQEPKEAAPAPGER